MEAECGLHLRECVYLYVGRCQPEFSDSAICYVDPDSCDADVSPFDTGGIWFGDIPTDPAIDGADDARAFLSRYTYKHDAYLAQFRAWVDECYDAPADYIAGEKPSRPHAETIDLEATCDARAWTWEMRIPKIEFPSVSLEPVALCMARPRFQQ